LSDEGMKRIAGSDERIAGQGIFRRGSGLAEDFRDCTFVDFFGFFDFLSDIPLLN